MKPSWTIKIIAKSRLEINRKCFIYKYRIRKNNLSRKRKKDLGELLEFDELIFSS